MYRTNGNVWSALRARERIAGALIALAGGCAGASAPPGDVSLPLEGDHVFVTGGSSLHVIDAATLARVTSVEIGAGASEVQATRDGHALWAVATDASQIALVDPGSLEVRIVPVGARPVHSYLDPDGTRIWVGNDGSGDVSIVDLATGVETTRALTGNGHHKIAFVTDAEGLRFAYVSNISDGTITVLDPTGALVTNVSVGPAPHGIDYSARTRRVYNCSGDDANSVEVLDPFGAEPHSVVSRIALPARCGALHVDEDGVHAWASIGAAGLLARIDLDDESVETFDAGPSPDKWVVTDDRIFVANVTEPIVSVIDRATGERRTIAVGAAQFSEGRGHRSIAMLGDRLFVPNDHDGTVTVIDVATEAVITTLDAIPSAKNVALASAAQ